MWADFVAQEVKHLKTVIRGADIIEATYNNYLVICEADGRITYSSTITYETQFSLRFAYSEISSVLVGG